MVFWVKADASLSLTAHGKYGIRCQGKIYPSLSFYQLSNVFDFFLGFECSRNLANKYN